MDCETEASVEYAEEAYAAPAAEVDPEAAGGEGEAEAGEAFEAVAGEAEAEEAAGTLVGAGGDDPYLIEHGDQMVHLMQPSDLPDVAKGELVCPVPGCGRSFKNSLSRRSHLRSHPDAARYGDPDAADKRVGAFFCCVPGCKHAPGGVPLANRKGAVAHYKMKHTQKTHACPRPGCDAVFALPNHLRRHLSEKHNTRTCTCGIVFGSSKAAKKHLVSKQALGEGDAHVITTAQQAGEDEGVEEEEGEEAAPADGGGAEPAAQEWAAADEAPPEAEEAQAEPEAEAELALAEEAPPDETAW